MVTSGTLLSIFRAVMWAVRAFVEISRVVAVMSLRMPSRREFTLNGRGSRPIRVVQVPLSKQAQRSAGAGASDQRGRGRRVDGGQIGPDADRDRPRGLRGRHPPTAADSGRAAPCGRGQ